jgi:S-adenosylmethionine-dependent methyltransferase
VLPERVTGSIGDDRKHAALRAALLDTHFSEFRGWFVPWVRRHAADSALTTTVEIGCRRGELTAALALAFARVEAYEADGPDLEFARSRMRLLDLDNVEFRRHGPLDRLARIRGDHPPGSVDCAILFGVLQRLDGAGRLDTLRTAWEVVRPGGLIVIASTPNQGVTGAPARPAGAGGLPDAVVGGGGGTSYGEFVAALGVVDPAIAGDGFDPEPLRQFGVSAATRTRCLAGEPNRVPPAFLRESVDVILRKPDGDHRNPIADRNLRDIIGTSTEAGLAVTGTAAPMNRRGAPP